MQYIILAIIFLGGYSAAIKFNQNFVGSKDDHLINIFVFSVIFLLIYLINSYLLILNIELRIINFLFFIFFLVSFLLLFLKKIKFKILSSNKLNIFKKNYLITLILFCYFILILFPAFDEDSLRYHLPIGKKMLDGNFFVNHWFDYISLGANEFINVFFLNLNISYGSSIINYIYLIFFIVSIFSFQKKIIKHSNDNFLLNVLILISSPYLISLLTSQKLFLMPSVLSVLVIIYVFFYSEKINNFSLNIMGAVLIFCFLCKLTFITYLIFFYCAVFFFKFKKVNIIKFFLTQLLILIIMYFPILYIKYVIYKDPFLPIISLNKNNYDWFSEYKPWLTSYQLDITDTIENNLIKYILLPLKLIFPLAFSDIFKSLGLGVLLILTCNFDDKKIKYLSIFFFFNVLVLQNTQTRWFLPFLIFISFFANINKYKLFKNLIKFQSICALIIIIPLSIITVLSIFNLPKTDYFKNLFYNSNTITKEINQKYNDQNIYTSLNTFHDIKNFIPIYYPQIVLKMDKNYYLKSYKKNDLVLWKKLERYALGDFKSFDEFAYTAFKCSKYTLVKKYKYNNSRFFIINKTSEVFLYRLNCASP